MLNAHNAGLVRTEYCLGLAKNRRRERGRKLISLLRRVHCLLHSNLLAHHLLRGKTKMQGSMKMLLTSSEMTVTLNGNV